MIITLKNLTFSKESLESYYDSNFHEDLRRYFKVENIEDGAEVINNIKERGTSFVYDCANILIRNKRLPAAMCATQGLSRKNDEVVTKDGTLEEEFFFMALVAFMYSSEERLASKVDGSDKKELIACMNAFGFPWIGYVSNHYELSSFLDKSGISDYIIGNKESDALCEAMQLVEPFMIDKLTQHLSSWNNGYFNNQKNIGYLISEVIREGLYTISRRFYTYSGLTGLTFSPSGFANYYENSFFHQMEQYFDVHKRPGKCSLILEVHPSANKRWEDGNPGNTIAENFMFSGMFLHMIVTEQAILKFNEEASDDFHQASGWPLIYSGPGGGPYLHPLYFIQYAGLLPRKSETMLYLELVNKLFPFMQQKTNEILNGKGGIKDIEAGSRFYGAIRKQVKSIKRYILEQEEQIIELLNLWINCEEMTCSELIRSQNLPIQYDF